jgi:hypothetical protein
MHNAKPATEVDLSLTLQQKKIKSQSIRVLHLVATRNQLFFLCGQTKERTSENKPLLPKLRRVLQEEVCSFSFFVLNELSKQTKPKTEITLSPFSLAQTHLRPLQTFESCRSSSIWPLLEISRHPQQISDQSKCF